MLELFKPNPITLKNFRGDLFGGLTVGIVALPLALAFGVASGLENGAQAGLYGAILVGLMAALFGGTVQQVSGPTGPMTVVAAGLLATSPNPQHLFIAVLLGGVIQIAFGLLGAGKYIRYVPQPVISGFMTGIGVIILLIQLQPLAGLPSKPGPVQAIAGWGQLFTQANLAALGLGLFTIAVIYLVPRVTKAIPGPLVALVAATALAYFLKLDVPLIGALPAGLPMPSLALPTLDAMPHTLLAALTLAIVGSLDTLLGSVVVDNVTNTKHHSNKELVGQGLGNMTSGLFGGLPGAGATMRTLLNIRCGGKTALSGLIHCLVLIAVLFGLSGLAALIPLPVLAGILVTVGIGIIDYNGLRSLPKAPRADRIVLVLVLALTVLIDLITAVQMGFLVAALLFLRNLSDRELIRSGSLAPMVKNPEGLASHVQVIQVDGPIFFGTSEAFVSALETEASDTRAIILRMARVPLIDQSGAYALRDFVARMKARGVVVILSGLPEQSLETLRKLGIVPDAIPEDTVFPTLAKAVAGLNAKLECGPETALVPKPYLPKVGG